MESLAAWRGNQMLPSFPLACPPEKSRTALASCSLLPSLPRVQLSLENRQVCPPQTISLPPPAHGGVTECLLGLLSAAPQLWHCLAPIHTGAHPGRGSATVLRLPRSSEACVVGTTTPPPFLPQLVLYVHLRPLKLKTLVSGESSESPL